MKALLRYRGRSLLSHFYFASYLLFLAAFKSGGFVFGSE